MRPVLFTSLLFLFSTGVFGQTDTSTYRDLSNIVGTSVSVYEVQDSTDDELHTFSTGGFMY